MVGANSKFQWISIGFTYISMILSVIEVVRSSDLQMMKNNMHLSTLKTKIKPCQIIPSQYIILFFLAKHWCACRRRLLLVYCVFWQIFQICPYILEITVWALSMCDFVALLIHSDCNWKERKRDFDLLRIKERGI